jgi:hypothetical protein
MSNSISTPPPSDLLSALDGANTPFDVLLGRIDNVIAEWRASMDAEPWNKLHPARLIDSMPEILPRLFKLAAVHATQVDEELKSRIADDHGTTRRTDEIPLTAVTEEWGFLKRACWHVMRQHGVAEADAVDAMARIDLLIDDAVGYTLRGYYRPELDSLKGQGLERRGGPGDRRENPGDRRASPTS